MLVTELMYLDARLIGSGTRKSSIAAGKSIEIAGNSIQIVEDVIGNLVKAIGIRVFMEVVGNSSTHLCITGKADWEERRRQ